MSIESRLVDIRSYLEDIASTQRQLLAELRRGNGGQAAPFVGTLETEPPPASVAKEPSPSPGYDDMTVQEVLDSLKNSTEAARARVLAYERQNKNRKGIIEPLVNWNS